jgi:hypothetical protein
MESEADWLESVASPRAAGAGKASQGQGCTATRHCKAVHHGLACLGWSGCNVLRPSRAWQ